MSKHLSLYALFGLLVVAGVLFYRVIQPFVVALFVAVVLAVLFEPFHKWLTQKIYGRQRIAAALTTCCVVSLLVVPVGGILLLASGQLANSAEQAVDWFEQWDSKDLEQTLDNFEGHPLGSRIESAYQRLPATQQQQIREVVAKASDGVAHEIYLKTGGMVGDLLNSLIGFAIMTLGLYYFLADGETFLSELHRLLPLGRGEEEQLFHQFQLVCRGVVLGTVLAGLVQAILAGVAFAVLGIDNFWLLGVLTMCCSFIPFVGSFAVWAPVTLMLLLDNQTGSAIGLGLFGTFVVATSDNVVRAYVISGEAKLHPLIALVSVLGAVQLIGLWGVFVGPMVAAFFYSLAQIFRARVLRTLHEAHHQQTEQQHDDQNGRKSEPY